MLFRNVIREVQSEYEQDQWYRSVTNAALYLAIGGFLDEANRLLKELWKHNLPHNRNTWLPDRAFEILWYAAGKRPEIVPFKQISLDELEIEHRDYIIPSFWISQFTQDYTDEITDNTKALILSGLKEGRLPDSMAEEKALSYLIKYLNSIDKQNGYEISKQLSIVTELASKNGKKEIAINTLKKWAPYFDKYPYDSSPVLIGCNRHVAPLLLEGIIADELKLTSEICSSFVNEAINAIEYRIKNGPMLVFGDLGWAELIRKLSVLSIKDAPELFTDEQKSKHWIGKPPATREGVRQKEKQLGFQLPEDYREFLFISNGLSQFSIIQPELSSVEEIAFLKSSSNKAYGSDEIFEIIKTYPGKDDEEDFGLLVESAIAVSELPYESEVWLIPPRINNTDWECWEFSSTNPGERRYKSFRHFIEWHIQFLENESFSK
jgi:SMI1 / KNR4 family (SUKH-1)